MSSALISKTSPADNIIPSGCLHFPVRISLPFMSSIRAQVLYGLRRFASLNFFIRLIFCCRGVSDVLTYLIITMREIEAGKRHASVEKLDNLSHVVRSGSKV